MQKYECNILLFHTEILTSTQHEIIYCENVLLKELILCDF